MTNSSNNNSSPTSSSRLIPSITSQTFRVVTQYGDLLVVRQGAPPPHHGSSHAPRHRHRQHSVGSGAGGGGGGGGYISHESTSESPLVRQGAETLSHGQGQGQSAAGTQTQSQNQSCQQQQYDNYLTSRPYILTFHDLGLNHELQFAKFCETDEVKLLLQTFTMVHVNFPGQEFDANDFEQTDRFDSNSTINSHDFNNDTSHHYETNNKQNQADYELTSHHQQTMISTTSGNNSINNKSMAAINYPSIEQMAEAIVDICAQLKIRSFIALAVGAGAYVVSLCALTRPQLVDGLFLINPTAHNATITEWLYFKMSAIALYSKNRSSKHSNQNLTGSEKSTPPLSLSGTSTNINSGASTPCKSLDGLASDSASLTSVASNQSSMGATSVTNSPALIKETVNSGGGVAGSSSGGGSGTSGGGGGSRLRRLILSRNFKMAGGKSAAAAAAATITTQKHEQPTIGKPELASLTHTAESAPVSRRSSLCTSVASCSLNEDSPNSSNQQQLLSIKQTNAISGRAPVEYLMYHHFGITSMQSRVRRNSDHSHAADSQTQSSVSISGYHHQQQAAGGSNTGGSNIDTMLSASTGSPKGSTLALSSSLSATHLASLTSERERHVFIQNAYRQHFNRLNAHNLWLFVQSFARRKSLNLRKDCGVAAHAAAAAASLSTSICAAFVGIGTSGAALGAPSSTTTTSSTNSATTTTSLASIAAAAMQRKHQASGKGVTNQTSSSSSCLATNQNQIVPDSGNKDDSVQIAGTKVKRTFACQTLIMTSSVQVHCERAFKLMSLLHPLRATCIKTDCELVLEEQPEKVCKALRLFLQGIGFSMSTFERRLRLSSATGSASSADSATSLSQQSSQYHH